MSEEVERSFGRIASIDGRDHQMMRIMAAAEPYALPLYRYWQPGTALDQGQTSQCVGFAWEGFLRADPVRTYTGPGPSVIYHEAQLVDEFPGEAYEGTSVRGGAKFLNAQHRLAEYAFGWAAAVARAWVLGRGPLVFGTDWTEGMMKADAGGWVRPHGAVVGGHAYLCYGYSTARNAFRFLNSWGRNWGDQGAFWMSATDVDNLMKAGGECCSAVELRVP